MDKRRNENSYMDEKRMHPRSPYVKSVSYRLVADENDGLPINGKGLTQNISYSGMCFMLNSEVPPGSILELEFEVKEKESNPIMTRGEVVWLKKIEKGFLAGVKFLMD